MTPEATFWLCLLSPLALVVVFGPRAYRRRPTPDPDPEPFNPWAEEEAEEARRAAAEMDEEARWN